MNRTAYNMGDVLTKEHGPECPYCGAISQYVHCERVGIRGHDYYVWACRNHPACDAYVGCHRTQDLRGYPLGRLADKQLRDAKVQAHSVFDMLWKQGHMTRAEAYKWLQRELNIENFLDCHIGEMTVEQCYEVYSKAATYLQTQNVYNE